MQASTARGMRPFVVADCVRALFTNETVDLTGSGTTWSGQAPNMPQNDTPVGIQVGCCVPLGLRGHGFCDPGCNRS